MCRLFVNLAFENISTAFKYVMSRLKFQAKQVSQILTKRKVGV